LPEAYDCAVDWNEFAIKIIKAEKSSLIFMGQVLFVVKKIVPKVT
jgi:hypothetical protein